MKMFSTLCLTVLLCSCYSIPEIEGFDKEAWTQEMVSCSDSKIEYAELILEHEDKLLGEGQAEVKALLGPPSENELYLRNQKFFYYDLTLNSDSCEVLFQRLSLRFDALDRVSEIMIIEGDN